MGLSNKDKAYILSCLGPLSKGSKLTELERQLLEWINGLKQGVQGQSDAIMQQRDAITAQQQAHQQCMKQDETSINKNVHDGYLLIYIERFTHIKPPKMGTCIAI